MIHSRDRPTLMGQIKQKGENAYDTWIYSVLLDTRSIYVWNSFLRVDRQSTSSLLQ